MTARSLLIEMTNDLDRLVNAMGMAHAIQADVDAILEPEPEPEPAPADDSAYLGTLLRAAEAMALFTPDKPDWGVTEMARHFGAPKSTTHAMLSTLRRVGWLRHTPAVPSKRRYMLGPVPFRFDWRQAPDGMRPVSLPLTMVVSPASFLAVLRDAIALFEDGEPSRLNEWNQAITQAMLLIAEAHPAEPQSP